MIYERRDQEESSEEALVAASCPGAVQVEEMRMEKEKDIDYELRWCGVDVCRGGNYPDSRSDLFLPRDPGSLPFLRHPTVCHLRYSDREIIPGASFDTYSRQRFFCIPASPIQPVRYLVDTKTGAHSSDPVLERQRHVAPVSHRPKTQRQRDVSDK